MIGEEVGVIHVALKHCIHVWRMTSLCAEVLKAVVFILEDRRMMGGKRTPAGL